MSTPDPLISNVNTRPLNLHHNASTPTNITVAVPGREQFELVDSLPPVGDWVTLDGSDPYAYNYLLEDGMVRMWNTISAQFATFRQTQYEGYDVPINAMRVTSGYRNPERNERVGGSQTSRHMLGRALDVAFEGDPGVPSLERGILFGSLWSAIEGSVGAAAQADYWQLEVGTTAELIKNQAIPTDDGNNNDVPDVFEDIGHLHIQDNP